jgi:hypothetical protein
VCLKRYERLQLKYLHRVQRSIRGDCYVKRGVSVPKRLICSNKGTESDQNY